MLGSVETQPGVVEPPSFTMYAWEGSIGGGALAVDVNDPNVSAPAPARIRQQVSGGCLVKPSGGALRIYCANGTTVTLVPWFYDDVKARWFQWAAAFNVTPTVPGNLFAGAMFGVKWFFQITANTGVEMMGYVFA